MNAAGRIVVLDLLRALAIFAMIVVHVNDRASGGGALGTTIQSAIDVFVESKSAATFAILFGAGFAISLRQADAKRQPIGARFLRRMAGLFAFGLVAQAVFGYPVLIAYAVWGCVLLPVRHWSTRSLAALMLVCSLLSVPTYNAVVGGFQWMTAGAEAANAVQRGRVSLAQETQRRLTAGSASSDFHEVVTTRAKHMMWYYQQPFSFLPQLLVKFLIGLLALRLGVWERPAEHRTLIVAMMCAGLLSAGLNAWVLPLDWPTLPVPRVQVALRQGLGLLPEWWLSFVYIGAVLLAAGHLREVQRLLGPAGQMALTNYLVHIALVDIATSPYGFGITLTPQQALLASTTLFMALVAASHVWLRQYRFGPAEWLLRCVTDARMQPARRFPAPRPSAQAV